MIKDDCAVEFKLTWKVVATLYTRAAESGEKRYCQAATPEVMNMAKAADRYTLLTPTFTPEQVSMLHKHMEME